jgi:hypothetical protein
MKIIAGVAVLVVVIAGGYLLHQSTETGLRSVEDQVILEQEGGEFSQTGTLAGIRTIGGNVQCTFTSTVDYDGQVAVSNGVIYSAGDRLRVDSVNEITVDGNVLDPVDVATVIIEDEVYVWFESVPGNVIGSKVELNGETAIDDQDTESLSMTAEQERQIALLNQEIDYECEDWDVDERWFELPVGVEFNDPETMIEQNMAELEDLMQQMEALQVQ